MTEPDIAALAKGLSKTQRGAIVSATLRTAGLWKGAWEVRCTPVAEAALRRRGIVGEWPSNRLTPIGLLVRDYLKENGDG